jgi:hypothetical protein
MNISCEVSKFELHFHAVAELFALPMFLGTKFFLQIYSSQAENYGLLLLFAIYKQSADFDITGKYPIPLIRGMGNQ